MTVRVLHRDFLERCKSIYSDGEASAITSIIFEYVTGLYRSDIVMYPERFVPEEQQKKLNQCLQDVMAEKPVQYITGEAWFYNLKLAVNCDVLIPRPETEQLAEIVLTFLKTRDSKKVLDIGTGSGCIPVAIKYHMPSAEVSAIDICDKALAIAKNNASMHAAEVSFMQMDFLNPISWKQLSKYDAIVSNPPYIPLEESITLENNVRKYEPERALFVKDSSPLIFYEYIAAFGKEHLHSDGQIFVEVHERFARQTAQYFNNNGYATTLLKDMFGKERIVNAIRCR